LQVAFATLVADRAIKRMVDEQELHHAFTRALHLLGACMDDHAIRSRHGAGSHRPWSLLKLDKAHAAVACDGEALVIAEARDFRAGCLAGLQQSGAVCDLDLNAVDDKFRHDLLRRPCHTTALGGDAVFNRTPEMADETLHGP